MKPLSVTFTLLLAFLIPTGTRIAAQATQATPLRVIAFGAHPDDAELKAAGVASLWSQRGAKVKLVAMTNGDVGHFEQAGGPLAKRRKAEVQECAKHFGSAVDVLDIHDGELMPTLENRRTVARLIREWQADIVMGHRPNDYHPDHRYVGVLVQDASFMVTVPYFCPDVPFLKQNPVFLYSSDAFQKPYPFRADIAVSLDDVLELKLDAIHQLESQVYEGGAIGNEDFVRDVPPASTIRAAARPGFSPSSCRSRSTSPLRITETTATA
jgi:LmbE family N-acetylglucosaminyl deacetylase